jgi:hypothetical protein
MTIPVLRVALLSVILINTREIGGDVFEYRSPRKVEKTVLKTEQEYGM